MGEKERLFGKLLLILAGMLLIGYILSVSIRMNRVEQPGGDYVRLQDALILAEALEEGSAEEYKEDYIVEGKPEEGGQEEGKTEEGEQEEGKTEEGDRGPEEEKQGKEKEEKVWGEEGQEWKGEWEKALEADGEALLTYGQFLDWADIAAKEIPGMPGRKELKREFGKKYREGHFILKEDWYAYYQDALEKGGMTDTIITADVTVFGVGSEVSDGEGGVLEENTLLAQEGVFSFRSDSFREHKYQVLRVYRKDGELLVVQEVVSRGMEWENIWVMEAEDGKRLQAFYQGQEIWVPYDKSESPWREQVADLVFADGALQSVTVKDKKVSGKLLSVREGELEIEGAGKYPYDEDMKVYKLYGRLAEGGQGELRIGYDFTDFVLDNGVICAGLLTRDEAMENIRVVIKTTGYGGAYHDEVRVTADTDFTLRYGEYGAMEQKEYKAGDTVTVDGESDFFTGDRIYIEPAVLTGKIRLLSVERSQGEPSYRGKLEIAKTPEGLVVVNELLLEEYLYSVVPSEMPASYPLEALKAQAVCARTYAYRNMVHSGIAAYGAHVDDSAGYQVYNNISENVQTTKAVRETTGQLLYYGEELCGSFYYSTSCGFGTDAGVWKSDGGEDTSYLQAKRIGEEAGEYGGESLREEDAFEEFITNTYPTDYESGEAWYRWEYEVEELDGEELLEDIKKRYAANPKLVLTKNGEGVYESLEIDRLGEIRDIYIAGRGGGGVADELVVEGTENTVKVISEHNIRYVLCNGDAKVVRQDGSRVDCTSLLPSGYFTIMAGKEGDNMIGYRLAGGGYGHGVGMSQNGAKEMAKKGFTSEDILTFFYDSCNVRDVY